MVFALKTKFTLLVLVTGNLYSCGGGTRFSAPKKGLVQETETPCAETAKGCNDEDATLTDDYRYHFVLANGAPVVRQGPTKALAEIYLNDAKKPLADDSKAWKVSYKGKQGEIGQGNLGEATLDLSTSSGLVSITAEFTREADERNAKAVRSVFVDALPPVASLVDLGKEASGEQNIFWNAYDNFGLNNEKSALIACETKHNDFLPVSREEMENIPADCVFIFKGQELHSLASQSKIGPYVVEDTTRVREEFMLYVEDEVGLAGRAWMAKAAAGAAQLNLSTNPTGKFYTRDASFNLMTLLTKSGGGVPAVDIHNNNSEWPNYEISFSLNSATPSRIPYTATRSVPLPSVDGLVSVELQANHKTLEHLISNKAGLNVVVDRTPPLVKIAAIHVDSSILSPTAVVNLRWSVDDQNPIFNQIVEIQLRGQNTWSSVATLPGTQRTLDFTWGSRQVGGFTIRITAIDMAGNQGQSLEKWTPQIFNTALLTRGVECLYCHIKVQGDMGGIDFPARVRHDTGEGFFVTGKVYSTNIIPRIGYQGSTEVAIPPLGIANKPESDFIENYKNTGVIIFPKEGKFPVMTESLLRDRMNGTLEFGSIKVERVHNGPNLIVNATPGSCFKIKGEVLVIGDLVIGGCYTGQGSIYATKNIFIIDDLKAVNGIGVYPVDPAQAKARALQDLANNKDQLFLGAVQQIVIGSAENRFPGGIPGIMAAKAPYPSWMTKDQFRSMCKKPTRIPGLDTRGQVLDTGAYDVTVSISPQEMTDDRVYCGGMDDIQAYLYAGESIHMRTYRNFRIIGGIFTPYTALLSAYMWKSRQWINPTINENSAFNTIYFDERLKHGSKVGEAIKSFFDQ